MSADYLRETAALMRRRAEVEALPKGAAICTRGDHPTKPHGHYGYGARYWCSDFGSALLSDDNMGSRKVYAKPVKVNDPYMFAVADLLDRLADENGDFYSLDHPALKLARAYRGETA